MAIAVATYTDAVNRCLSAIGTSRITSLPILNRDDVDEAEEVINEILLEVLAQGWHFNTDVEVEIALSGGYFDEPAEVLQLTVPRYRYGRAICVRSDSGTRRLWDMDNLTFTFTTPDPIKVDIVWGMEFNLLPQAAKWYISTRAARQYASRMLAGEAAISGFSVDDEMRALAVLKEFESDTGEHSMFDNEVSQFILDRGVRYYG